MDNFRIESFDNLFEAILKLENLDDCRKFFEDVCTIKELQDITQRLEVAKLLSEKKNYQEVCKLTGASIYSLLFAADESMNLDHRNHFTITLSRTAVDRAFEMSEGANDGTESDAWMAIVNNTESYYTITLI